MVWDLGKEISHLLKEDLSNPVLSTFLFQKV
jgi:hypothetical protein